MVFANIGTIGVLPGMREAVVEILTRPNPELINAGCLQYDVGVSESEPNAVFVIERWESEQAHQASLQLASVQALIHEARPMLSGQMDGGRFHVVGSPIVQ